MFKKRIELIVQKIKLHKRINQKIFDCLFEFYQSKHFLKSVNTFSFSVTHPEDPTGRFYLMVANFPDEEGFVQTQIVDENLPVSANLKNIATFEDLIKEIESFLKTSFDLKFHLSIDSEDSERESFKSRPYSDSFNQSTRRNELEESLDIPESYKLLNYRESFYQSSSV